MVSIRCINCDLIMIFDQLTIFQAIELAAESLANVKFVQEKRLIQKYFDEISHDTGKYCFGIEDTLKALELGAVETLIVWENMDITRHTLRNAAGGKIFMFIFMAHFVHVGMVRGNHRIPR